MKTLCIYHGNCADGFGAAWVVRKALGRDIDFHAGVYQNPPPDVAGREVIMVDFSYKRPVLERMSEQASSILILDHHKTAAEDLEDLPLPAYRGIVKLAALFDLERSGAGIAWDYFFPDQKRPPLIDHIEDRDLWRFVLPGTREIQAALFSYPYDFGLWDELISESSDHGLDKFVTEGAAIERTGFNVASAQKFGHMVEGVKIKRSADDVRSHIGTKRKFASAMIAKIPLPLSRHIAACWKPA